VIMKKRFSFYMLLCVITVSARSAAAAEPTAFLRADGKTYYIVVKADPPLWNGRDPVSGQVIQADVAKDIIASVYQNGRLVPTTIAVSGTPGFDFIVKLTDISILNGDFDPLLLAVHRYPTGPAQTAGFSVDDVSSEISASLTQKSGTCVEGFPLEVKLGDGVLPSDYILGRLETLLAYMRRVSPTTQVESDTAIKAEPRQLKSDLAFFGKPTDDKRFFECLALAKDPPSGTFDIKFTYPADAPIELRHPFLKTDIENASHGVTPFSVDDANVGERAIEENLDLSLQFSSSVADKTVKDAAGMDVPVRVRDNTGTLDLRIAPLLNLLSLPDPGSTTFKFLTPLLIDARVSTGKINKDTLSLNRIVIGSEFEIRHYTNTSTFPSYQRYILSFRNASDRDFKQAEWKGALEFQPVFSALDRPLRFRRNSAERELDQDPDRAPKDFPTIVGFGIEFLPLVGFEMGKTWRNKSPFAAIEQTEFVRRLYFGGTLNLDLTAYVRLSLKDILYVRGETSEDRLRNYFLGSIEVPLPSFTRNASSNAFFSFERGAQPPFASPGVNALKIGYRVQWDGWFGKRR